MKLQFVTVTVGCSVGPLNYVGNEPVTTVDQQLKRSREVESISRQQKRRVSLKDNLHRDESGLPGCVLNPNPISTGLKLSCEEDEHNSSVSSACENVTCAIPVLSLGGNLKAEIDRQKAELDHYIRLQVRIRFHLLYLLVAIQVSVTLPTSFKYLKLVR